MTTPVDHNDIQVEDQGTGRQEGEENKLILQDGQMVSASHAPGHDSVENAEPEEEEQDKEDDVPKEKTDVDKLNDKLIEEGYKTRGVNETAFFDDKGTDRKNKEADGADAEAKDIDGEPANADAEIKAEDPKKPDEDKDESGPPQVAVPTERFVETDAQKEFREKFELDYQSMMLRFSTEKHAPNKESPEELEYRISCNYCESDVRKLAVKSVSRLTDKEKEEQCKGCYNYVNEQRSIIQCYSNSHPDSAFQYCEKCVRDAMYPEELKKTIKLPFHPHNLILQAKEDGCERQQKWTCCSSLMQTNMAIPEPWAHCNFGMNADVTQEHFEEYGFKKLQFYQSTESNFRICQICVLKWLEYFKNPKEGVDYSKFDESSIANVKTLRELNIGELEQVDDTFLLKSPLKKSLLERSSYFSQGISRYEQQSGQTGENLYESMSQKFVRDSLYKNIRQAQFDVQPFIPTLKEHGEHYTPRHREQLKEGFQSTEDFESKGIDMQTINYKDNYWIVVSAFEKQKFKKGEDEEETIDVKTLKIYTPNETTMQFELKNNIILQSNDHNDNATEQGYASYLHFGMYLYYFKRVFFSGEGLHEDEKVEKPKKTLSKIEADESIPDMSEDDLETNRDTQQQMTESYLQLCRYDLQNNREKYVLNYVILEEKNYLSACFNINFGEQFIMLSTKGDLNYNLVDNGEEAIRLAKEANDKFQSSTIIIDVNHMQILEKIGDDFGGLQEEADENFIAKVEEIAKNHSGYGDEEEDDTPNEKLTLQQIKDLDLTDVIDQLGSDEQNLFKQQYFILYQYSKREQQKDEEAKPKSKPLSEYHHLYRMDKIKTPIRAFEIEGETERITKVLKTIDMTFGEFQEQNKYPNLQMDSKAQYVVKKVEADETEAGKKKQRALAVVAAKTTQDFDNLVGKAIIQVFCDSRKVQITVMSSEDPYEVEEEPIETDKQEEEKEDKPEEEGKEDKDKEDKDKEEEEKKPENIEKVCQNIEIFEGSALYNISRVWSLQVKDCVLPNQEVTASYTQYVTYDIENESYILVYPNFTSEDKIEQGDGDATENQTLEAYLIAKAEKQTECMPLAQMLLKDSEEVIDKLKKDLGVFMHTDYSPKEFDFFNGNHYQDLIWLAQDGNFTVNILQFCKRNQTLVNDKFYNKPIIGKNCKIVKNEKEDKSFYKLLHDNMDDRGGKTVYFNAKYRDIIMKDSQITDNSPVDSQNQTQSGDEVCLIEGPNGKYVELQKPKKAKELEFGGEIIYRTKSATKDFFVIEIKDIKVFIIQPRHDDQPMKLNLRRDTEIFYIVKVSDKNFEMQSTTIKQFLKMPSAELEKIKVEYTFQEIVDSRHESPLVPMIYAKDGGYSPENLFFLVISTAMSSPTVQGIKIQQNEKINERIYYSDIKLLRTSPRLPNEDQGCYQTQFTVSVFIEQPMERYQILTIQVNEPMVSESGVLEANLSYSQKALKFVKQQRGAEMETTAFMEFFSFVRQIEIMISVEMYAKINATNYIQLLPMYDDKFEDLLGFTLYIEFGYGGGNGSVPFMNSMEKSSPARYSTDIMFLEQRKLFQQDSTNKQYALLVDCKIKQPIIDARCFDQYEQRYLLDHAQQSLLNMCLYNLKEYILDDKKVDLTKMSFFRKREILFGNTLSELFVKDPTAITDALNADVNKVTKSDSTVIEEFYSLTPNSTLKEVKEQGFFNGNSVKIVQSNFYQENILTRAFRISATKTAGIIIDYIFGLTDKNQYQPEIMKALPQILSQEKLDPKFLRFFESPDVTASAMESCNLEIVIDDKDAPIFGKSKWNVLQIEQVQDFNNSIGEMVAFLNEHQAKEKKSTDSSTLYDIQNTYIDFRCMVLSQKFKNSNETATFTYEFNSYSLAQLIEKMVNNSTFFQMPSIQKVIDFMYVKTEVTFKRQFTLFVCFYYIPYIITIFLNNKIADIVFTCISSVTLSYFLGIEYIQFSENGFWSYLDSFWNISDMLQYICFILVIAQKIFVGFEIEGDPTNKAVSLILFENLLIMFGFIKIMFFLQLSQDYSALVSMVGSTFGAVGPFINFFLLWVAFFTVLYYNLQIQIDSGDEEYLRLPPLAKYFMMTYRDSIGDISIPGYEKWDEAFEKDTPENNANKFLIIIMIWAVWLLNQFMCLIVLLNFLIAVISQVYDNVVAESQQIMFINKAMLNVEYFQFNNHLGLLSDYKILIFQINDEQGVEEDDVFQGFVQTIKNHVSKTNKETYRRMDAMSKSIKSDILVTNEKSFDQLTARVMNNEDSLSGIKKTQNDIFLAVKHLQESFEKSQEDKPAPVQQ